MYSVKSQMSAKGVISFTISYSNSILVLVRCQFFKWILYFNMYNVSTHYKHTVILTS